MIEKNFDLSLFLKWFDFIALNPCRSLRIVLSVVIIVSTAARGAFSGHGYFGLAYAASVREDEVAVSLQTMDERTGASVGSSKIFVDGIRSKSSYEPKSGSKIFLGAGPHKIRIEATGYRTADFPIDVNGLSPGEQMSIRVHLPPLRPPAELEKGSVDGLFRPDRATIVGFITSDEAGGFLEDVTVSVPGQGLNTYTDKRGFFVLQIPLFNYGVNRTMPDGGPELVSIRFEKAGYITQERNFVQLLPGDNAAIYRIALKEGEGAEIEDERFYRANAAATWDATDPGDLGRSIAEQEFQTQQWKQNPENTSTTEDALLAPLPCDSWIRVGRSACRCGSSTVEIYMLERYTQLVLPSEWFASWNSESLKAGAVAVRSYGGYFVQRPLCGNYDICDSACCQVFNPNREDWRTNQAVDDTYCQMLIYEDGSSYFAQYSAENNSLNRCGSGWWCTARGSYSCSGDWCDGNDGADGVTGQCNNDDPDSGFCRYGHGRGMCQWGTQGWATRGPEYWYVWLLNNYYPGIHTNF